MVNQVTLSTMEDVQRLNRIVTDAGLDLSVSHGDATVDARSLLALFTMLGKTVSLVAPENACPEELSKLVNRLGVLAS